MMKNIFKIKAIFIRQYQNDIGNCFAFKMQFVIQKNTIKCLVFALFLSFSRPFSLLGNVFCGSQAEKSPACAFFRLKRGSKVRITVNVQTG